MQNKYFILERACNTPETGPVYPQIQKMKQGYDNKHPNSIYSYLKKSIAGFPNEEPNMDAFILHRSAKPTDIISNTITDGHGYFVSQKLKLILEEFQLPPHRFFKAKVIHNGKYIEDYFWLHMISDMIKYVDYSESDFFIYHRNQPEDKYIKVSSAEDFLQKEKKAKTDNPNKYTEIRSKKTVIKLSSEKKPDLMQIGRFDFNFYISKQLRDALNKNHIKGCDFNPIEKKVIIKQQ